ncbi:SET domain-containing protein [Mycena indigotica]|uniref:SET domain-containing protein n=1 Tax=Mycena indigotica TaxID=2126181 RepID=A0A8H6WFS4_9AGAR|nr:SET domain-containing protein [Mycena indigotica]KAF7315061.1 SET domain-containing protein [Mycena indigotica]
MASTTTWSTTTKTFRIINAPISNDDERSQNLSGCSMLVEDGLLPMLFRDEPPRTPDPPNFYVASAGNKGAGMFAARDIPAGALILVDRPVAIVPSNIEPLLSWKREAFDALIARIIPSERERLLQLANCHSVESRPIVEGIALTNAFGVELGVTEQEYGGIFPSVSRANHCCGLNTAIKWDPATFSVSMYSLCDVQAGEEIYNQYIDVLAPRAERRAQLARYDFICLCQHCDLPDDEAVAKSDAARAELRDWRNTHTRFEPWAEDMCRSDDVVIESSLRALELVRQEGLWGMQVPFMEDLALSYAVLGDEEQFRVWAEKVVELCSGQDPKRANKFAQWLADPASYRRWGWRTKQRKLLDKQKNLPPDIDISIPW